MGKRRHSSGCAHPRGLLRGRGQRDHAGGWKPGSNVPETRRACVLLSERGRGPRGRRGARGEEGEELARLRDPGPFPEGRASNSSHRSVLPREVSGEQGLLRKSPGCRGGGGL